MGRVLESEGPSLGVAGAESGSRRGRVLESRAELGSWRSRVLVTGSCESKGEQLFAADLGVKLKVRIHMDFTIGICIGSRQGLGGMKWIHARFLWVQDETKEKRIQILKVGTQFNYSDILTKRVTAETMNRLMADMGFEIRQMEIPSKK